MNELDELRLARRLLTEDYHKHLEVIEKAITVLNKFVANMNDRDLEWFNETRNRFQRDSV